MPKVRTHHICQKCGYESIRWLGRCPDCGSWNSMTEEVVADAPARASSFGLPTSSVPPRPITDIDLQDHHRLPSGIQEFDRVLGGGPVPGSIVLIGGDPGIGKCVTGDTQVFDVATGDYRPITDWATDLRLVLALDGRTLTLRPAPVSAFHERGVQPIVKVRTGLGRELRCTPEHPILTPDGWRGVGTLPIGSPIATVAPPGIPWPNSQVRPEGAPEGSRGQDRTRAAAGRRPRFGEESFHRPGRAAERSCIVADACVDPELILLANPGPWEGGNSPAVSEFTAPPWGDVYWDEIASITPDGEAPVYDLTVPGPANFVANDLIVHNSTLLMQVAARLADEHGSTLYVTGEESVQQVRMRADRLGTLSENLLLAAETNLDVIEAHAEKLKPDYLVVDSIQTAHDPSLSSAPATVSQLRACCARMTRLAKTTNTTVFLVGHVTKEGAIAGPRVLEHMVDTVLYFEGDRFHTHRILRSVKNRFGSTDEIGIFVMRESGLMEVANASEWMLAQRPVARPGSSVVAVVEGTRPLLVEVQALVSRSFAQAPRRMATGLDFNRVCMILAVLEKRCGLRLSDKDVYVNVPGGIRVAEPAADLGIAVALASSYRDTAIDPGVVVTGEIGLSGEVRAVQQTEKRLMEAQRLGFERALIAPSPARLTSVRLEVDPVETLRDALDRALTGPAEDDAGNDEPPGEPEA